MKSAATLSYRFLYLGFVQCDIINLHFRDFPFEISATFTPHTNFLGIGCNLITYANVIGGFQMSVDIERVTSPTVIVTCCNMNPLS